MLAVDRAHDVARFGDRSGTARSAVPGWRRCPMATRSTSPASAWCPGPRGRAAREPPLAPPVDRRSRRRPRRRPRPRRRRPAGCCRKRRAAASAASADSAARIAAHSPVRVAARRAAAAGDAAREPARPRARRAGDPRSRRRRRSLPGPPSRRCPPTAASAPAARTGFLTGRSEQHGGDDGGRRGPRTKPHRIHWLRAGPFGTENVCVGARGAFTHDRRGGREITGYATGRLNVPGCETRVRSGFEVPRGFRRGSRRPVTACRARRTARPTPGEARIPGRPAGRVCRRRRATAHGDGPARSRPVQSRRRPTRGRSRSRRPMPVSRGGSPGRTRADGRSVSGCFCRGAAIVERLRRTSRSRVALQLQLVERGASNDVGAGSRTPTATAEDHRRKQSRRRSFRSARFFRRNRRPAPVRRHRLGSCSPWARDPRSAWG